MRLERFRTAPEEGSLVDRISTAHKVEGGIPHLTPSICAGQSVILSSIRGTPHDRRSAEEDREVRG